MVERGGLENRCAVTPYRGFESLPLRLRPFDEGLGVHSALGRAGGALAGVAEHESDPVPR